MNASTAFNETLQQIIAARSAERSNRPPIIGVAGAQGSGKTFQCRSFAASHAPRVAHFSLDDVYLTHEERQRLARDVHPLFATRGPPGTHDLALAERVFDDLQSGRPTFLPRFDKSQDDRLRESQWLSFEGPADSILFDGWCLGAMPWIDFLPPNPTIASEDKNGAWRKLVGAAMLGPYGRFSHRLDEIVFLKAPNFEIVRRWRLEQEEAMLGRTLTSPEHEALQRFIDLFEPVTRAMLTRGIRGAWVLHLDNNRNVVRIEKPH